MAKPSFPIKDWDEKKDRTDMLERSYLPIGIKTISIHPSDYGHPYDMETIHDCNILALNIWKDNKKGLWPSPNQIADRMYVAENVSKVGEYKEISVKDIERYKAILGKVLECVDILNENGFLDPGYLFHRWLFINPAKKPDLDNLEQFFKTIYSED